MYGRVQYIFSIGLYAAIAQLEDAQFLETIKTNDIVSWKLSFQFDFIYHY